MPYLFETSRRIRASRLFKVLCIGGVGFIAQTICFELLSVYFTLLLPSTATVVGGEVGLLTNFYLNNRFSFTDRLASSGSLPTRLLRFHVVVSGSIFIQWLFLFIAQTHTTSLVYIHATYVAGVLVGFVSNYMGYYFWVWKQTTMDL